MHRRSKLRSRLTHPGTSAAKQSESVLVMTVSLLPGDVSSSLRSCLLAASLRVSLCLSLSLSLVVYLSLSLKVCICSYLSVPRLFVTPSFYHSSLLCMHVACLFCLFLVVCLLLFCSLSVSCLSLLTFRGLTQIPI